MTRTSRIVAEFKAGWLGFVRRRTAVFFTFFFPGILVVIFGALVGTQAAGIFARDPAYYVPGYLAVVVVFTPLSRVSSTVARHREGRRFEKLATTPLSPSEWLVAHSLVNAVLVAIACLLVLVLIIGLTNAQFTLSILLGPIVILGTGLFCGIGALLGRLADSPDGAIAASNAIGLPLLFLSETFVPPELLPGWFQPLIALSPLTYFARTTRIATQSGDITTPLVLLFLLAVGALAVGTRSLPWRS